MKTKVAYFGGILAICLTLFSVNRVSADITFNVIADENTVAPGGNGSEFRFVSNPIVDGDDVVFFGQDPSVTGVFRHRNGTLERMIGSSDTVPGTGNSFGSFNSVPYAYQNGKLAFVGGNAQSSGVFVTNGTNIDARAQRLDSVPGRNGSIFFGFSNPKIHNNEVVFQGAFGAFTSGVYHADENGVSKVFDSVDNRLLPGSANRNLRNFFVNEFDGSNVLFAGGQSGSGQGIYKSTLSGSISLVADTETAIPDGVGNFTSFDVRFSQMDEGGVVFHGRGDNNQNGIYLAKNGTITTIADFNTLDPSGTSVFTNLNGSVIDGDRVFFQGIGAFGHGVFMWEDGALSTIVSRDDVIDGRRLTNIHQNVLSVDGDLLTFAGATTGGSTVFSANLGTAVPEPSSLTFLAGLMSLACVRRKRSY